MNQNRKADLATDYSLMSLPFKKQFYITGQTHYKKYLQKSWREGVRHRAKRLFLGLPLARAVRLSYQRTYSLHEPRVLAIYSSPSLTEIVV